MAFIRVLLVAIMGISCGGCDLAEDDDQSNPDCVQIVGWKYNNEEHCAYPEPVKIGCYQISGRIGAAVISCYLSPEEDIIYPQEYHGQPGSFLLDEGWTLGCSPGWCEEQE